MFAILCILCLTLALPTFASTPEPTLARLSVQIPEERMEEFANYYEEHFIPVLEKHGFPSSRPAQPEREGFFSRIFEFESPAEWAAKHKSLNESPGRPGFMRDLTITFESLESGSLSFALLSAPMAPGEIRKAGPGTTVPLGPGKGHWRTYDVTNGLAGPWVPSIVQDKGGHIWFATYNDGVSCYDGQSWTTFTTEDGLVDDRVGVIYIDREENLWFGTVEGVSKFDGHSWTTFTSEDGLADNRVGDIYQDRDGNMWFSTMRKGVSRYDGATWTTFTAADGLPCNRITSIIQDRDGNMWFGTYRDGVSRYDGATWTTFTTEDGLADNTVWAIYEDREGALWFGTNQGVSRYDGRQDGAWTSFSEEEGLGKDHIVAIAQDSIGDMWFARFAGGVTQYDGEFWRTFTSADGLPYNNVWAIYEDREGYMWFATSGGVSRYDGRSFTFLTTEDGLAASHVHSIYRDRDDNIWVANGNPMTKTSGGGVSRLAGDSLTTFTTADGLVNDEVYRIYQDRDGNIWFTAKEGISRYDGQTFANFTRANGIPSGEVVGAYQDRDGDMWFGTWESGVSRFDGERLTTFTTEDGLATNKVVQMFQDSDGNIWFGSDGKGATRYDGRRPVGETFTIFTTKEGLAHDDVLDICEDDQGNIWFATHGGISRYDGRRPIGETFTTFTTKDGLAANDVHAIFQGEEGDIWIGTDGGGVSRFDGQVFQNLTREDGLASNLAFCIVGDGKGGLWICDNAGLTRFQAPEPTPLPVFIDAVVANRRYHKVEEVAIPASVGLVAFEFRAMSFKTPPDHIVYLHRLQGYEEEWRQTRSNRVEYADLPRGDYVFQIRAVDRDLNYSQPASVGVVIHFSYAQIAWRSGLALAIGLILILGVRLASNARKLRLSNDRLSSTNQDLHLAKEAAEAANRAKSQFLANISHEIRTPMNAILGYAQILQHNPDLDDRQQLAVETIENSGEHLLGLINEVLDISKIEAGRMELHPVDFDLAHLLGGLAHMFELRCKEKDLSWNLERPDWESLPVRGDEGKLRQVLINLLSNAVKFTEAGDVTLSIEAAGEHCYRFSVVDTGVGIAEKEVDALFQPFEQGSAGLQQGGTGLGLSIARRQIELMGSRLEVDSAPGDGSRFSFALELPSAAAAVSAETVAEMSLIRSLAPGCRIRALVVDDVRENRDVLGHMLSEIGVEVETAEDGEKALERMAADRPDIVFLDIRMPVIDGLETLRRAREREDLRAIKVVAISASVFGRDRREYIDAGFVDFIAKPFRFEQVTASLQKYLQAEFEYAERQEPEAEGTPDWGGLRLPGDLLANLRNATRLNNVTNIERYLKELEQLGDAPGRLAVHLRRLKQQFDMRAIGSILGDLQHE